MRILYHFRNSPFSRRARLSLAHKGLDTELCEAREQPERFVEIKQRSPFVTVPVLVEPDGRLLGDSGAIAHYLDRAYPDRPRLWPVEREGALEILEMACLVDHALEGLTGAGNRFYALRTDPAWPAVHASELARIQRALDALAERVARLDRPTIAASGWSAADIWVYTATRWLQGLPHRDQPVPRQISSLGWRLPDELVRWAEQHAGRPEVRALEA